MATTRGRKDSKSGGSTGDYQTRPSSPVEEMLLAAAERGDDSLETGRLLVSFKEGAGGDVKQALSSQGLRIADARDFDEQAATLESLGDADAVIWPGDQCGAGWQRCGSRTRLNGV